MDKPYHLMTPAERLTARIAKNNEIAQKVADAPAKPAKAASRTARKAVTKDDEAISSRQKAVSNRLEELQRMKKTKGADAASDFILEHLKK